MCSSCFSGLQATFCVLPLVISWRYRLSRAYIRSSGFCCRWPDDVECTTDTATSSGCHCCCFWTISFLKTVIFSEYWRIERFRDFCDEVLYKSTFYIALHYALSASITGQNRFLGHLPVSLKLSQNSTDQDDKLGRDLLLQGKLVGSVWPGFVHGRLQVKLQMENPKHKKNFGFRKII